MSITWVLERDVFDDSQNRLSNAAASAGQRVIWWDDRWWEDGGWPSLEDEYVIFQGSLGNASRIATELPWRPGAFCNTSAFACSAWYTAARKWLAHETWVHARVSEFVQNPTRYLSEIGSSDAFFVRPDSPLKPFSGRVLRLGELSLEALDYGFYYDDENLPVVVTPVLEIGAEFRFVIRDSKPIAWSGYEASARSEKEIDCPPEVSQFVEGAAAALNPPDPLYVLDSCQVLGKPRLLELNPFSGADLYACDRSAIVAVIKNMAEGQ